MSIDNHVAPLPTLSNNLCVTAKSVAGIGTPNTPQGAQSPAHAYLQAGFFVCAPAHLRYGGLGEAASAGRDLVDGSSNLVQFATQRLEPLSGEYCISPQGGCHHGYYPYPRFTCNLSLSLSPLYPFVCGGDRMSHLNLKMEYCLGLADALQQDISDENRDRLTSLLNEQLHDLAALQNREEEKVIHLQLALTGSECRGDYVKPS
ncbi:hypothetical protein [Enterovibrio norvegicus]|uniref:hypothetical protein n=1 Tax=Enterovibrio norvegicus TaxID=188144 RepID=UPI0013D70ABB|nr:hypothetical protein [Enterovibrio norvegicus]